MKTYYFTLLLVVFFSCSNEQISNSDENSIDIGKIEAVKKLKNSEQRTAFRMLDDNSKLYVWMEKLNFLENTLTDYNQIQAVKELKSIINVDIYSINNENDFILNEWTVENKKYFSKKEFINFFVTLTNKNPVGFDEPPVDDDTTDCDCNKDEDYCMFDDCLGESCSDEDVWFGCGLLWASDCNGVCG